MAFKLGPIAKNFELRRTRRHSAPKRHGPVRQEICRMLLNSYRALAGTTRAYRAGGGSQVNLPRCNHPDQLRGTGTFGHAGRTKRSALDP